MNRSLWAAVSAVASVAALTAAGSARAADVSWSIGIGAPGVGAVISNGPFHGPRYRAAPICVTAPASVGWMAMAQRYRAAPICVTAPAYDLPAAVDFAPPRVVYRPAPVVYGPVPVVDYVPVYRHRGRPLPLFAAYPAPYRGWAPPMRHHHGGY